MNKNKQKFTIRNNSQISVYILEDKEVQALNKEYRGKDYPTDVLSFEIQEEMPGGEFYVGDIIVNKDQAQRQMKEYGNTDVRFEIAELVAHGVLHLLGVDHDEEGNYILDEENESQKDSKKTTSENLTRTNNKNKDHTHQCACGGACGNC